MEAMEITSDVTKIKLATFQLEGKSQSVVGLGQSLEGLRGNAMERVS